MSSDYKNNIFRWNLRQNFCINFENFVSYYKMNGKVIEIIKMLLTFKARIYK